MSNFPPKPDPMLAEDTQPLWRDSSAALESGLDVVELHVDVDLPLEPVPPKVVTAPERRSYRPGVGSENNRSQWRASFEEHLSLLRPHLVQRVLAAMSHVAWTEDGTKHSDPVKAAKAWSVELDKKK